MTVHGAPPVAMWLAQRLISGPRAESLLGDLVEQHAHRRSTRWYWRQVLTAVVVSTLAGVRDHKLLAARALLVGWGLYYLLAEGVIWTAMRLRYTLAIACGPLAPYSASCRHLDVSLIVVPRLLASLACVIIGWALVRFNHDKAMPFVLLFAASVFVFEYGMMSWMFAVAGILPHTPAMILPAVFGLGRPGGVLIGGLLGQRRPQALRAPC